jgi:hypothetical protein
VHSPAGARWPPQGAPFYGGGLREAVEACVRGPSGLIEFFAPETSGGDAGALDPGSTFAYPTVTLVEMLERAAFEQNWFMGDPNAPFGWLGVRAMEDVPFPDRLAAFAFATRRAAADAREAVDGAARAMLAAFAAHLARAWTALLRDPPADLARNVARLARDDRDAALADAQAFFRDVAEFERAHAAANVPRIEGPPAPFNFGDVLDRLRAVIDGLADAARQDSVLGRSSIVRGQADPFSSRYIP